MNWTTAIFYIKRLNNASYMMIGGALPAAGVLENYFPCNLLLFKKLEIVYRKWLFL
jgi:hypothetical protein